MNHHQFPLASELYRETKGDFRFIEIASMPESFRQSGYPVYDSLPYLIKSWENDGQRKLAHDLIMSADVVVFEAIDSLDLIKQRLEKGGLTFECGERWLKRGLLNLLSPRLLKSQWVYHTKFYNKPIYRLCASAYAASDLNLMRSFKNRCYKWGYFTEFKKIDIATILSKRQKDKKTRFITIARLIDWKRNDLIIQAAKILKSCNIDFEINIYGSGDKKKELQKMIKYYNLENDVFLKGCLRNDKLIEQIQMHDALILASNRQEGWGAVVNEGMSNACPVIGSVQIGSVPYLIKDGYNGLIFESGNYRSLANQMIKIAKSQKFAEELAQNAYETMEKIWSPKCAARNLLMLIEVLKRGRNIQIDEGPCSPA